jgi:predicted Zn-dependent protease
VTDQDPAATFDGQLFDGATGASGARVTVRIDAGAGAVVATRPGGPDASFPFASLSVARGGWDGDQIVFSDAPPLEPGRVLFVADARVLEELASRAGGSLAGAARALAATVHRRGLAARAAIAVAGVVLLLLVAEIVRGAPRLVSALIGLVPASWEQSAGETLVASMLAGKARVTDPVIKDAVDRITGRLMAALVRSPYRFTFHVIRDDTVNAFAVPGGQIVLLTGLLREAGSAEEVAGVLAHELQHVLCRHSLRALTREMGLTLVLSVIFGDAGAVARAAGGLLSSKYSRSQESEADLEGARLLVAADLPLEPGAAFFDRLAREGGSVERLASFVGSHPASADRAVAIRALARENAGQQARARLLGIDWTAVRQKLGVR